MSVTGGILKAESFLLAISGDGGSTWCFVDGAGLRQLGGRIGTMLPNFPPDLDLPRKKEPIFIAAASEAGSQTASQAGTREKKKMSMADWEALAKSPPVVQKDKTEQVVAGAKGSS